MRSGNGGQVLVIFVLALLALIAVAAIAVDIGYMYSVRNELQRCADTGALAGASAFFDGEWNKSGTRAIADGRARDFAHRDVVATAALDPVAEVSVAFNAGPDRIRVDTTRTVPLFFSRFILGPTRQITATAVAEATIVSQHVPCIKPWGIPFPWNDDNADGLYTPGEQVNTDCPEGTTDPANHFCQGTQIILKVGTPQNQPGQLELPSMQQESGHFFALDFGAGARTYEETIKGQCPDNTLTFNVGDTIPLKPGNMVGPTYQGVEKDQDSLFAQDPDSHWDDAAKLPDSSLYPIEGGHWMSSPRVVRIPVYDPRDPMRTGSTDMTIAGFAGFWVEDVIKDGLQATVIGRFIPNSAFGQGSGTSSGEGAGPVLKRLRLVE